MTKSKATVPPVIRPGQRKPFKKCTQQQVEERIEFTATLVARQFKKHEIFKALKQRYNLEYRQSAEYITRAKAFLTKQATMSKPEAKELAINVLLDNMKNGKPSERTGAVRVFAEITGINEPNNLRVGDPNGKPLAPAVIAPVVNFIMPDNGRAKNNFSSNGSNNGHAETATARNGK